MAQEKGEGLGTKLNKLLKIMEVETVKEKKDKSFKIPGSAKTGIKQKIKKNYVLVFLLRTNGQILIRLLPIQNDMIYLKDCGTYHIATTDYIGYYKKYPAIIIPEWSLKPISRAKHIEKTIGKKEMALPQKVIINAMKLAQIKPHGAGGKIIWIILGGCVIAYFIYSSVVGQ